MRWLLITNNGNPGDIWVRLGCESIIRDLDPKPVFIIRERDYRKGDPHNGLTEPEGDIEFDYSVICGMPLLWSHKEPSGEVSSTVQHKSWHPITTWLSTRDRMIIAGFGIFLLCPDGVEQFKFLDQDKLVPEIEKLFSRCRLVYSRSPLAKTIFNGAVNMLACPSVLALPKLNKPPDLKLCNFMPGGSHYPHLAPEAAGVMELKMPAMARQLIEEDFWFVAHNEAERKLAAHLGWPRDRTFVWHHNGDGDRLLDVYARCCKYIGNRIHGGIMSRAAGADVVVIGYDTRLADVYAMGGQVFTPFTIPDLTLWIKSPSRHVEFDVNLIRRAHVSWWSAKVNIPRKD